MMLTNIKPVYRAIILLVLMILSLILYFILYIYILGKGLEGDVEGLEEKLNGLDRVERVENYYTHEGSAFFTLILDDKKSINLHGVDNKDLDYSYTNISGVNGIKVVCNSAIGGRVGISTYEIENLYGKSYKMTNIQDIINNINRVEEVFGDLPFKIDLRELNETRQVWSCKLR